MRTLTGTKKSTLQAFSRRTLVICERVRRIAITFDFSFAPRATWSLSDSWIGNLITNGLLFQAAHDIFNSKNFLVVYRPFQYVELFYEVQGTLNVNVYRL